MQWERPIVVQPEHGGGNGHNENQKNDDYGVRIVRPVNRHSTHHDMT
jgi:hypothetical protein